MYAKNKRFNKWLYKVNEKFNNKFDYSKVEYINNDTKVNIICPTHGEYLQSPDSHLSSKFGCPKCGNARSNKNRVWKQENCIKAFKDKHSDKFDYSKVNYKSRYEKVTIICPIHGEFETTPDAHIGSKTGCPKCGRNMLSESLTEKIDDFIEKAKNIHGDKYDYSKVEYASTLTHITIICPIHGEFEQVPNNHLSGNGCPKCGFNLSKAESEISDLIPNAINNDRALINPKEIDILSHEYKFGIEYDGLLWHSYGKTFPNNFNEIQPYAHLEKTKLVEAKSYQLFHIFENEWLDPIKQEIWKSMINSKMNKSIKVFARKCKVKLIDNTIYKDFMNNNHMQGYASASVKLGLIYDDELIAVMSFVKARYNNDFEFELLRFCNKLNYTTVGGASKLLKYFERNYNPKSIVSYANRRWSQGGLYEKIGFSKLHESTVNYYYINDLELHSRIKFQKHKLREILKSYDDDLSERENMINNEYRIIYDCGNLTYGIQY